MRGKKWNRRAKWQMGKLAKMRLAKLRDLVEIELFAFAAKNAVALGTARNWRME
jgi:hypothetical protein